MPVSIEVDMQRRAIVLTATGSLTGDELVKANEDFFRTRMEDFRKCRTWLGDYSQANLEGIDMVHMRTLGHISIRAAEQNPRLAVAIATGHELSFGLARAWEGLSDATGWKTMVFRTCEQAQQWLDSLSP